MRSLYLVMLCWLAFACQPPEIQAAVTPAIEIESAEVVNGSADIDTVPAHLEIARSYIGVTETGNNAGPEINRFLASVDLLPGNNYCAAFVSYVCDQAQVDQPAVRSGVAQHFRTSESFEARHVIRGTRSVKQGDIVIWQRGDTWMGHVGIADQDWPDHSGLTVEANTSPESKEDLGRGDGVYRKNRTIHPGAHFRITHFTNVTY